MFVAYNRQTKARALERTFSIFLNFTVSVVSHTRMEGEGSERIIIGVQSATSLLDATKHITPLTRLYTYQD